MILGVPCYQNHDLTARMVASLAATVRGDFTLVIVDNGSPTPYRRGDFDVPFRLRVIRNERNEGNFWPLAQVAGLEPHEFVALAHNDVIYHEPGWNLRVEQAFRADPALGLIGFAGSAAIGRSGRRVGTLTNFRGTHGHARAEDIGERITGLVPSAAVDGLFMAFRRTVLDVLTLAPSMPPAHWYDFIWGAQVHEAGWRVATLGIEVDHVGWQTEVKLAQDLEPEWRRWCIDYKWDRPDQTPMETIRYVGRVRWERFGPRFWPCRVDADYQRQPFGLVTAISMFRNEEDVAEYVVRHMLDGCDRVIVADNGSTDRTRAILAAIDDPRLTVVDEPRFEYRQADTMNALADRASEMGTEWIVPFDADEWWHSEAGRIADVLTEIDANATATQTCDMIPQPTDPADPNPFRRIVSTRPGSLWAKPNNHKVAFRPGHGRLMQGNHGIESQPSPKVGPLRIRHYPFRSFEQAAQKLRHGRAAVLAGAPPGSGLHWQEWGSYSDEQLAAWWREWTDPTGLVLA